MPRQRGPQSTDIAARPAINIATTTSTAQTTTLAKTSAALPNISSAASAAHAATVPILVLDRTSATQGAGSGFIAVIDQGTLQEALLTTYAPGQTVTIQIDRDGAKQTLTITLG